MAISSVVLDIRANTSKALGEFKKFSSQLDNKFLISGLKLDVVRSALGQINREFQKAIGEQGLTAGVSMRAAENQAALLTQTFKSFSQEASIDMSSRFTEAFNSVAVQIGSTTEDVKKAINATPWISTNLSQSLKDELTKGFLEFETTARRAGMSRSYAEIIQRFLMNQVTPEELINSGNSLESTIGLELAKVVGVGGTPSSEARSRAVLQLQRNSGLSDRLRELQARADWGQFTIEQLISTLFNPQKGFFGAIREITMSAGDKTSLFRETKGLIESVFGRQGFFLNFFKQIGQIFSIEDPLKVVILGVRWITRQFNRLTNFLESPLVQGAIGVAQGAISGVANFFTSVGSKISGFFSSEEGQRVVDVAQRAFAAVFTLEATMGGIIGAILGSVVPGVGTVAGAAIGGSIGALSSLFEENSEEALALKTTYGKALEAFGNIFESVEKDIENGGLEDRVRSVTSSAIFTITGFFDSIFDTINSGEWDATKINAQIDSIGSSVREFIENLGKNFREADFSKEGEFFLGIFKNLVGEIFKTLGVAIKELIATLFSSKGAAALGAISSVINTAIVEFFKGLFGDGVGGVLGPIAGAIGTAGIGLIFARKLLGVLVGVLGPFSRELRRVFAGGGGPAGFVNRMFGGGRNGPFDPRRRHGGGPPGSGGAGGGGGGRPPVTTGQGGPPSALTRLGWAVGARARALRDRTVIAAQSGVSRLGRAVSRIASPTAAARARLMNMAGSTLSQLPAPRVAASRAARSVANVARGASAALPTWAKVAILGLGAAAGIGVVGSRKAKSGEMPPETSRRNDPVREKQLERDRTEQNRKNARTALGIGAGLAGGIAGGKAGALAGGALGSFLGPKGTVVGGVVGGILGSIVGGILGEEAVKKISDPVLDGAGKFANKVKSFFTETLPSQFSSAVGGVSSAVMSLRSQVESSLQSSLQSVQNFDLGAAIRGVINKQVDNFQVVVGGARDIASSISSKAQELFLGAITNFSNTINSFKTWVQNLPLVRNFFGDRSSTNTSVDLASSSSSPTGVLSRLTPRDLGSSTTPVVSQSPRSVSAKFDVNINISGAVDTATKQALEKTIWETIEKGWADVTAGTVERGTTVI